MLKKILLSVGILATVLVLGNALTCQVCGYTSKFPKDKQKCDNSKTKECVQGIEYCFTGKYTDETGTVKVIRGCDEDFQKLKFCPNAEKTCKEESKLEDLKACAGACCKTDNCNDFTPSTSSASGIMVAKLALILMVIAGFVAW